MGYNITNINGDLAIGRNAEIGCDADIHGKARVAGSLKVEGFLDAPNIKGVVKGLFVTEEELNREYPNPRPGWCAIVLADDESGFLYLAKSRKWEKQSEEAKPFDFIVDSISVFASKGELEAERLRATEAEEQLRSGIEQEATRATEAENNIKSQALLTDTVRFSQGTRGVSLGGSSIDGRSVVDELIPVATTEMAGAMSPEDKVQILNNKKDIENTNIDIEELKTVLADGSFVVAVASLANSVKAGAVTFEMLDGHLKLSASVVDDLETANTLKPLSANQGKVLKELIDIINGTGEGSTDKKIADAIAKLINKAPENLDTLRELAQWIEEHGTKFAAVVDDINKIKNDALLTGSVHVSQFAEMINIGGRSLDGASTMSVDISAATTESAGVMSAEDKVALLSFDGKIKVQDLKLYGYSKKNTINLIDTENPSIKGCFINEGGKTTPNDNYNISIIPMNGNDIKVYYSGGFYLCAIDKYGEVTHVNNKTTSKGDVLRYIDGDEYACISWVEAHNPFAAYDEGKEHIVEPFNTPIGINQEFELKNEIQNSYITATIGLTKVQLEPARILQGYYIPYVKEPEDLRTSNTHEVVFFKIPNKTEAFAVHVSAITDVETNFYVVKTLVIGEYPFRSIYKRCVNDYKYILEKDLFNDGYGYLMITRKQGTDVDVSILYRENEENDHSDKNEVGVHSVNPIDTTFFTKNLFNPNDKDIIDNSFISTNGYIETNENYIVSGWIPFTESMGKIIPSSNSNSLDGSGASFALYDSSKNIVAVYKYSQTNGIINWESGVAYARVSLRKGKELQVIIGDTVIPYVEYDYPVINNKFIDGKLKHAASISSNVLNAGEIVQLTDFPWHIKKNVSISVSANIGNGGSISVGKGYEQYRGAWVTVDNTNVTLYFYESSIKQMLQVAHGLTINNSLVKIIMSLTNQGEMLILISTNNGYFKHIAVGYGFEFNFSPFVRANDTTLTDVKLSATCSDFSSPIWMFGDSYFGVATNRWPGNMKDFGFFNFFIDGLAGQDSQGAYEDLVKALKFNTPKYIVWCLGMNDGIDGFKHVFDKVKNICTSLSIEFIAATIPTVPERDKEEFAQYVKSSGVRYIDFYKAVGANSDGVWYDGHLSSDKVHPTEIGAQALASQVLIDFPELMYEGLTSNTSVLDNSNGDK